MGARLGLAWHDHAKFVICRLHTHVLPLAPNRSMDLLGWEMKLKFAVIHRCFSALCHQLCSAWRIMGLIVTRVISKVARYICLQPQLGYL